MTSIEKNFCMRLYLYLKIHKYHMNFLKRWPSAHKKPHHSHFYNILLQQHMFFVTCMNYFLSSSKRRILSIRSRKINTFQISLIKAKDDTKVI